MARRLRWPRLASRSAPEDTKGLNDAKEAQENRRSAPGGCFFNRQYKAALSNKRVHMLDNLQRSESKRGGRSVILVQTRAAFVALSGDDSTWQTIRTDARVGQTSQTMGIYVHLFGVGSSLPMSYCLISFIVLMLVKGLVNAFAYVHRVASATAFQEDCSHRWHPGFVAGSFRQVPGDARP